MDTWANMWVDTQAKILRWLLMWRIRWRFGGGERKQRENRGGLGRR